MGIREQNKAEKERRIREAAGALFREQGFAGTTTAAIAERAGIGTGTLFLYARSKEEILVLLWKDRMEAVLERAFADLPDALLPQLLKIFGAILDFYGEDPALSRIYVRELLFQDQDPAQTVPFTLQFLERLSLVLQTAVDRGQLPTSLPIQLLGANLFAAYLLLLIGWLNGSIPEEQLRPLLAASFTLQLQGVAHDEPHHSAR